MDMTDAAAMIERLGVIGILLIVVAYQTTQVSSLTKELRQANQAFVALTERYAALAEGTKQVLERVLERFR